MASDFDLYEDIITEDAQDQVASSAEVKKLQDEVEDSKKKLKRLMEVNYDLKTKCDQLETNMSSLIKTCRNEINRKNDVIAQLRREIDGIVLRRTMKSGSTREMRDLIDRLKKTLHQDKPPKLVVPEGPKKIKAKNGEVSVTNFSLNDVYTVKVGKTSFSCVIYGDTKKDNPIMTVERRSNSLKEQPTNSKCNESSTKTDKKVPEKREETKDRPNDRRRDSRRSKSPSRERSSRRSDRNERSSHRFRSRSSERDQKRSSDKENSKKSSDNKRSESSRSHRNERREPSIRRKADEKTNNQRPKTSTKSPSNKKDEKKEGPDIANLDTTELESLLAEKQQMLASLASEAKVLMDTGSPTEEASTSDKNNIDSIQDERAQDAPANTSIDGLISTQNFLENWPASSFSQQYRTPPPKDHRQRSTSETSTNSDFTSAAGISKILKGKLVPGSYVSPISGMIRTPTPSRDKVGRENTNITAANVTRTRHRSKEVAQAINKDFPAPAAPPPKNLVESLGLDISSSSADENSPVKRPAKAKKRKRPSLGFSGPSPMHQTDTKRKIVA